MHTQKKILVIATGGTIESFYGTNGDGGKNAPYEVPLEKPTIIQDVLESLEVSGTCKVYEACMSDSKGVNKTVLNRIFEYLVQHAGEYDGVVITHGTDTMPRNARMLKDMLETVGVTPVPIVFTGAMIPLRDESKRWRADSDAWQNLKKAVQDAQYQSPDVYIRMGEFVMNADAVDKNVDIAPDNRVRHAEFVSYDKKRWEPLTPF